MNVHSLTMVKMVIAFVSEIHMLNLHDCVEVLTLYTHILALVLLKHGILNPSK